MSRSPKDKPAEEVSAPTVTRSRREGRTKLWPADRPRYVMSLSEASNPYKGQSGETGQSVTSTINRRKKNSYPSVLRRFTHESNKNRCKNIRPLCDVTENAFNNMYDINDKYDNINDVNKYYYIKR